MNDTITKIEKYIDFLTDCLEDGSVSNISIAENVKSEYREKKEKVDFGIYLDYADKHYFASRVLFHSGMLWYYLFPAHQCIELYLKSYIKYRGYLPPDGHVLPNLVNECRKISEGDGFVNSVRLMTIATRFDPFYEYSRYPIQKIKPKNGGGAILYPSDIEPLDYFVYKMRGIIQYPIRSHDILKEGELQGLDTPFSKNAEFQFKLNNINFL